MPSCCRSGSTFSESVVVPVPADVLWATVVDLPALPSIVSMVTAFEWVSRENPAVQKGHDDKNNEEHNNNMNAYNDGLRL